MTNTGTVAGKDVAQLYFKAPYIKGGIEKASKVICAFDKTDMLNPGESQELTLKFYLQDVANYDFKDSNKNGFKGYELDGGDYAVILGKNAHDEYGKVEFKVQKKGLQYAVDRYTGNRVENRFTDNGFYSSLPGEDDVEFTVPEGQRLSHIGADYADTVPLALGNKPFAFELFFGIIEHGAVGAEGGKDRHLLSAAAREPEQLFPEKFSEPRMRHRLCRRQHHIPIAVFRAAEGLRVDGHAPLPAFVYPAVDRFRIDILIAFHCYSSLRTNRIARFDYTIMRILPQ